MGIEDMLQRLDDTFQLRLGGNRTAPSRHQTTWATLDRSHVLLAEAERILLRRLAVFASGWTLESAENISTGGAVERARVLEYLTRLVDASIFQMKEQGGHSRYRLLEPVRAYAAHHLVASGEAAVIRSAHAAVFVDLAERLSNAETVALLTPRLDALQREHDNFRAALRWLSEVGSSTSGIRLVSALGNFWALRGSDRGPGMGDSIHRRAPGIRGDLPRSRMRCIKQGTSLNSKGTRSPRASFT